MQLNKEGRQKTILGMTVVGNNSNVFKDAEDYKFQ
jgi:hypothetical protein